MKIIIAEFKRKVHKAEELQDKTNLPMLTGRQIAFMIYAYFKINVVQDRAISMNDELSSECVNDNLNEFEQTWKETLMALEKEPEEHVGRPLPMTKGEIDSHAKCISTISFRSDSP